MDDAERIPIDIGYEVAAVGLAQTDPRATLREDGTLIIDVSGAQPCAPGPSTDVEIVVCAAVPTDGEPLPPPAAPSLTERIGEALNAKVGPVELGSIDKGDGTRAFGARVKF